MALSVGEACTYYFSNVAAVTEGPFSATVTKDNLDGTYNVRVFLDAQTATYKADGKGMDTQALVTGTTLMLNVGTTGGATTPYVAAAVGPVYTADVRLGDVILVALSDETTDLTTGTKLTMRMPFAMTLTSVKGSLVTAATGATLLGIDIKEAGTTIFSTKPTFDASETTTETAATPSVLSDTALAADAVMTFIIDAVGNTTPGKGLKVTMLGTRTA